MIKDLPNKQYDILSKYAAAVAETDSIKLTGRVERIVGNRIEALGPPARQGDICRIRLDKNDFLSAQVVGINKELIILMPLGNIEGLRPGAEVQILSSAFAAPVGKKLLGRIISGTGEPMDGRGRIYAEAWYPYNGTPVNPLHRTSVDTPLSVGVRAIDGLNTVGRGQRIGIFAGSGVGKSTLIGMIARYTDADINVIALIGERGREVRDFIDKELGPDGLERSVVIIATSDMPAMARIRGSYLAHAIAEYFRDQGLAVNLLMDSVTRFAMAQREIGLAAGEPAATRGYPPSVYSLLPKLMERAGTSDTGGSITGFYAVLVEGDDMDEPIADAARSILDGHIVLSRQLAHRNHYPAIDVLASVSRCMKDVVTQEHSAAAAEFRRLLASYADVEDLINLNAYSRGSNPTADKAIAFRDDMEAFLCQEIGERETYSSIVTRLEEMFVPKKQGITADAIRQPSFATIVR